MVRNKQGVYPSPKTSTPTTKKSNVVYMAPQQVVKGAQKVNLTTLKEEEEAHNMKKKRKLSHKDVVHIDTTAANFLNLDTDDEDDNYNGEAEDDGLQEMEEAEESEFMNDIRTGFGVGGQIQFDREALENVISRQVESAIYNPDDFTSLRTENHEGLLDSSVENDKDLRIEDDIVAEKHTSEMHILDGMNNDPDTEMENSLHSMSDLPGIQILSASSIPNMQNDTENENEIPSCEVSPTLNSGIVVERCMMDDKESDTEVGYLPGEEADPDDVCPASPLTKVTYTGLKKWAKRGGKRK